MATIINDPYGSTGASLGSALGTGIGTGIQQLLAHKLEQKQYQQKQMRQQQEASRMAKIFEENNIDPKRAKFLGELYLTDPKAAEETAKHMGIFGKSTAEQQVETAEANKTKLGWAHQNLGEKELELKGELGRGELEHKLGYDKQEFARKEKEFELERARDKAALEHTAHKENMDKQQIALKMKEINQDYKNKRDALSLEKQKLATGGVKNEAQQRKIENSNKPIRTHIFKEYENSYETKNIAERAKEILARGQSREGVQGLLPSKLTFANEDTRELEGLYEQLANKQALIGGGNLTKARIHLAKSQKPEISQTRQTQNNILDQIIKKADRSGLALAEIEKRIIEENGGKEPAGLENKVLSEWMDMLESPEEEAPAANAKENSVANWKGNLWTVKDGHWKKVPKEVKGK